MTAPYDLHASLGYQITVFARITERRFEHALTPLGLSRVTWCVLLAVGQQKLQSPSDIATFVGIDRTATSRALRRLEAQGDITRAGGDKDRRKTEVNVSATGKAKLVQANQAAQKNADYFNTKLSWYERDTLCETIEKLLTDEDRDVAGL